MIERAHEVESPPCGVPGHERGHWEDVVLGIWWCPECGTEIWATEDADDSEAVDLGLPPRRAAEAAGQHTDAVPDVRTGAADGGDPASAPGPRASEEGRGWRDRDGGARLWHLILEAFGRAAR